MHATACARFARVIRLRPSPSFYFRHFWIPSLRRFDGSQTVEFQPKVKRKVTLDRHKRTRAHVNDARTHGTRRRPRRCVHPLDVFPRRDRPAFAFAPRSSVAFVGFRDAPIRELRPRAIGGGPGRRMRRRVHPTGVASDGIGDAASTSIDGNISVTCIPLV